MLVKGAPGDPESQNFHTNSIDLIIPEYSVFSTRKDNHNLNKKLS